MMNTDPDQLLHRLVVVALTLFVAVSLLLAAFLAREIWLQQRIVGLSSSLQTNIEELEETTEEIQSKMSEIDTTTESAPGATEWDKELDKELDNVSDLLEDVDQQLESIEDNIDEVTTASEAEVEIPTLEDREVETATSVRAQADQVFTIFAVLTGIAAVAIAVALGMAMRVQHQNRMSI